MVIPAVDERRGTRTFSTRVAGVQAPGVVESHVSAALQWGLDADRPPRAQVTVPRNHSAPVPGRQVFRADLRADEVVCLHGTPTTSPLRTVVDCARTLPFGPALAVADSALRLGLVRARDLRADAAAARGPGATARRRVAEHADGRAASCLESLLRALLVEAGIGPLTLQVALFREGHPYDLAVPDARVLIEADGARWHVAEARVERDSEDITVASVEDYVILRFGWRHVTRRPAWTVAMVRRTVLRQRARLAREARAAAGRAARARARAAS